MSVPHHSGGIAKLTIGAEMVLGLVVVAFQGSPARRQRGQPRFFGGGPNPGPSRRLLVSPLIVWSGKRRPRHQEVFPKDKVLRTVLLVDLMLRNRN
jgi:hypothetical protein